jgi:hypothetical protein
MKRAMKPNSTSIKGLIMAIFILLLGLTSYRCTSDQPEKNFTRNTQLEEESPLPDRESKIPPDQVKITPETDLLPPIIHSADYMDPVPVPYPVNTAGIEDSAFIMPDGKTLYFWFTPDPKAPPETQATDDVTGIYVSNNVNGEWQTPKRVLLNDSGEQALDGCVFILDDFMWFCTTRTDYAGLNWFTAEYYDEEWINWQPTELVAGHEIGELHISPDGDELYFHSPRDGGFGDYDIWVSYYDNEVWQRTENIAVVNSPDADGWPFITQDGLELWFTRFDRKIPVILRSERINGEWQEPELIISQFAGEASVDNDGNIYFTHQFYMDEELLEADIYVSYRIQ